MARLLDEIRAFQRTTGLSDHRVGMILASNGRLIERLENNRRIWPDTEQIIRDNIAREAAERFGYAEPSHDEKHGKANAPVQPRGEK